MRTCAVQNHDNVIVGMSLGHLDEKSTHLLGLHAVENHPVQRALLGADSRVEVAELPNQGQFDDWAYRVGHPAPGRVTHASKARLVLKQHQHRLVADLSVVLYCLGNRPGKVFLNNS